MVGSTGQTEVNFQRNLSHESNSYWHVLRHNASLASQTQNIPQHTTCIDSFPFNNFKYFLTLFSKFFASFPHGTCSLSVSCHYLALDGIYHPFRTALPSNSTRWKTVVRRRLLITNGVLTLHDSAFQPNSTRAATDGAFYRLQFGLAPDFQVELFPLHSPLLRESLLVYFPPVS